MEAKLAQEGVGFDPSPSTAVMVWYEFSSQLDKL